jgi:hypothetical protein
MPVGPVPQGPAGGIPNTGEAREIEIPDKDGKVVGEEKPKPPSPRLRPMTSRQKVILVAITMLIAVYILALVGSHMLH